MANPKSKKKNFISNSNSNSNSDATKTNDIEKIKNDVASFASSLGLASSSLSNSGFDDADFRPKKNLIPQSTKKPVINHQSQQQGKKFESQNPQINKKFQNPRSISNGKTTFSELSNNFANNFKSFERFKNLPKLPLVKARDLGVWYVDEGELEEKVLGGNGGERKRVEIGNGEDLKALVEKKKEQGERLLAQYVSDYEASRGRTGDIKMLVATQKSGTAADKVSAYVVLLEDNPIANIRSLDALIAMVSSKVGKRHALTGFEALRELFTQRLLPDRKLKTLFQWPLNHLPETKDGYSLLLFWYWEDCLKLRYERFVSALEEASKDVLDVLKDKALKTIYVLLRSKPEQERRLLSAMVNKLGDPVSKAASNADYHLSNLLSDHPNMKAVVIDEVDSFLFRPHLGLRAKYHAANFLSQIRLSHRGNGPKVAKRLIDVYFALFKVLISGASAIPKSNKSNKPKPNKASNKSSKEEDSLEHVELDSRLLSALLTGVNRAFPFVSGDEADEIVEVQTPMLFQLVHSQNFNVGIQALMLLDKISSKNQVVSDRYYRALYSKLLLPAAMNSSKAEMFIGLLLRSMKNDVNIKRVAAFSKRVLQVALQQQPQYACGFLFLLSEVLKARPPLWNMVLQNESVDEDLEHFEDIPDEPENLNGSETRNQEADLGTASSSDVISTSTNKDSSEDEESSSASSSEDDGSDEAEDLLLKSDFEKPDRLDSKQVDLDETQRREPSSKSVLPGGYDPRHREPSFCNANRASWWELMVLASHAHPSVSTMAKTLLSGANIVYNGNPLNDLSLTAFLDKFMEKKPKASTWHGGSQIEPAKKLEMNHHLIGEEILSLAEDDVPPEDLVFHKFYMNKTTSSKKLKKTKKKKKGTDVADAEEIYGGDESDNEEIEDMLDATEPSLDGDDGEYDYDDLDKVVDDDDEELVGNVSDNDVDVDVDDVVVDEVGDFADDDDESDVDIDIGDADDGEDDIIDDDDDRKGKKKKGKSRKKTSASPFASVEDYEHLLNEDVGPDKGKLRKNKKPELKKKRKDYRSDEDVNSDRKPSKKRKPELKNKKKNRAAS